MLQQKELPRKCFKALIHVVVSMQYTTSYLHGAKIGCNYFRLTFFAHEGWKKNFAFFISCTAAVLLSRIFPDILHVNIPISTVFQASSLVFLIVFQHQLARCLQFLADFYFLFIGFFCRQRCHKREIPAHLASFFYHILFHFGNLSICHVS